MQPLTDLQNGNIVNTGNVTIPTGEIGSRPDGQYATTRASDNRSIIRQNEAADTLANMGYRVEMLPETNGGSGYGLQSEANPDYIIEGQVFDAYAPTTGNIGNIWFTIYDKVQRQAERIVLILDDTTVTVNDVQNYFDENSIPNLKEIFILVDGKLTIYYQK